MAGQFLLIESNSCKAVVLQPFTSPWHELISKKKKIGKKKKKKNRVRPVLPVCKADLRPMSSSGHITAPIPTPIRLATKHTSRKDAQRPPTCTSRLLPASPANVATVKPPQAAQPLKLPQAAARPPAPFLLLFCFYDRPMPLVRAQVEWPARSLNNARVCRCIACHTVRRGARGEVH